MASTLLLALVFVIDLIAFGLAVAAEQRRSTVSFLFFIFTKLPYCFFPFLVYYLLFKLCFLIMGCL